MASEELQLAPPPPQIPQDDHRGMQPLAPQPVQHSAPVDSLTCQWVACGERCVSPEALYDHVCERHIGRKSTNNLNLTCQWGACRTTTVKRDHITSHMRVHVPLKPHKCDFCGKSFKRPQDLKKHVKTHADDSVLMRSPENTLNQQQGNNNGFPPDNKSAYSQLGHDFNSGPYPPPPGQSVGGNNSFYPNPQQYSGYGQVSYPAGTGNMGDQQSMDTRRRAIEALNDFLGDVKRRALDPAAYYDVGQRLSSQSLPLPVSSGNGYSIGGNSYSTSGQNSFGNTASILESFGPANGGGIMSGGGVHAPLTQQYSLPVSNARTKGDLVDIDRFLEQLQATVYENPHQISAAGIQQPGVHAQMPQFSGYNSSYRGSSNSPPQYGSHSSSVSAQPLTSVAQMANMTAAHNQGVDTPALTPASVSSYTSSGHSPISSHSRSSGDGASMYPQLPSVTGMSDMGNGYTSAAPSGLASGFDGFDGRRYSGGRLQREAPAPRQETDVQSEAMDLDEDVKTPRKDEEERDASTSNVDPALRGTPDTATPTRSETSEDRAQENWVENVRVIETLRSWIKDRLAQGDFERDADSTPEPSEQQRNADYTIDIKSESVVDPNIDPNMDPALDLKSEEQQQSEQEEQIAYPTLTAEA